MHGVKIGMQEVEVVMHGVGMQGVEFVLHIQVSQGACVFCDDLYRLSSLV
jgi:hypothetical protein